MVTAKRSNNSSTRIFETSSNVALLEKYEAPVTEEKETTEQARERMQRNLDKLLHYENYAREAVVDYSVKEETITVPVENVEKAVNSVEVNNEDIMPTKTTLQFGNAEDTELYNEARNVVKDEKQGLKLNFKGKIAAALYVLVVAIVFTLIILNSGVLTVLQQKESDLSVKMTELNSSYTQSVEKLEELENKALEVAEKDYGMIK